MKARLISSSRGVPAVDAEPKQKQLTPEQIKQLEKFFKKEQKAEAKKKEEPKPEKIPVYIVSIECTCHLCGATSTMKTKSNKRVPESLSKIRLFWCSLCEETLMQMDKAELVKQTLRVARLLWPENIRR